MKKTRWLVIVCSLLAVGLLLPAAVKVAAARTEVPLGEGFVIYSPEAEAVFGIPDAVGTALTPVSAAPSGDAMRAGNGALVFTITQEGKYFLFETGGRYLSTNNDEEIFLSESVQDSSTCCSYWFTDTANNHLILYSKTAVYGSRPVTIEYYSHVFSGWTYKADSSSIYEYEIWPLAADVPVTQGVVNLPVIHIETSGEATLHKEYSFTISVESSFGTDENGIRVEANQRVLTPDSFGGYTAPAELVEGDFLILKAEARDKVGVLFASEQRVEVRNQPFVAGFTPARGGAASELPEITVRFRETGSQPLVYLRLDGEDVFGELSFDEDGSAVYRYTPPQPLSEGRHSLYVALERADGRRCDENWMFFVGERDFQLFFGQLHAHTAYSDGAGSLEEALKYIASLPPSENVHFVAITDHSNYFDASSDPNPEGALYDMSLASEGSRTRWEAYNRTITAFNATHIGVLALPGFEMTWSGGPGHINTFNTPGIVSRNNGNLNRKDNNAGMQAYYDLLKEPAGEASVSQFNHPSTKFGTFGDFALYDEEIDARIFLVEVGNGSGMIGGGGYFPSYEYYTMALDKGWHVAPTNNQDNHRGAWGNSNTARDVVLAPELTEEGIYEAIRQLRVYATEDKNLEIVYTANGALLGSTLKAKELGGALKVRVDLFDPDSSDAFRKVELITENGRTAYTWDDPAELAYGQLEASLAPSNRYYYLRVVQRDGDIAVTAPIWVDTTDAAVITSLDVLSDAVQVGKPCTVAVTIESPAANGRIVGLDYTLERADGTLLSGCQEMDFPLTEGSAVLLLSVTPDAAGYRKLTVTATVAEEEGSYLAGAVKTLVIAAADGTLPPPTQAETQEPPAEPAAQPLSGMRAVFFWGAVGCVLAALGLLIVLLARDPEKTPEEPSRENDPEKKSEEPAREKEPKT